MAFIQAKKIESTILLNTKFNRLQMLKSLISSNQYQYKGNGKYEVNNKNLSLFDLNFKHLKSNEQKQIGKKTINFSIISLLLILGITSASYAMMDNEEAEISGGKINRNPISDDKNNTEKNKNGIKIKTKVKAKVDTPIGFGGETDIEVEIEKPEKPCIII